MHPTFLAILVLDATAVFLGTANLRGWSRWRWGINPLFIVFWYSVVVPFCAFAGYVWAGAGHSRIDFGLAMLFCILTVFPQGLLLVAFVSVHLSHFFTFGSLRGIRNDPTCDQALAAEKRGDLPMAERLFRERLKDPSAETDPRLGLVHLQFGNFLQRRQRIEEAIEQWQVALAGNLTDDQHIATAVRTAEALSREPAGRTRACSLLQAALPRARGTEIEALSRRIASLQA